MRFFKLSEKRKKEKRQTFHTSSKVELLRQTAVEKVWMERNTVHSESMTT